MLCRLHGDLLLLVGEHLSLADLAFLGRACGCLVPCARVAVRHRVRALLAAGAFNELRRAVYEANWTAIYRTGRAMRKEDWRDFGDALLDAGAGSDGGKGMEMLAKCVLGRQCGPHWPLAGALGAIAAVVLGGDEARLTRFAETVVSPHPGAVAMFLKSAGVRGKEHARRDRSSSADQNREIEL
ncbi:hypothetical protein DFJ74DRAFT_764637 [Hyaloraphidium curvatum]|nr:hypothetical protein DFJ74DRAFT_764637 [Hyaloraphidium curvatum]